MYTSKFKLALHWLLFITGFYILWGLAYLVLTKFLLSQFNRFADQTESIWAQLTASDVFWYAMFIFGLAIVIYITRKFIQYAPNQKVAAMIYGLLIVVSFGIFLNELLETTTVLHIIPHLIVNLAILIPILITFFKKQTVIPNQQD